MCKEHRYRHSGRNWLTIFMLAVALFVAWIGVSEGPPPPLWWIPIGGMILGLVYLVINNPVHGSDFTEDALVILTPKARTAYPYEAIDYLEIIDWSESTGFRLHLKDGSEVTVHPHCLPEKHHTIDSAEAHGVAFRVS